MSEPGVISQTKATVQCMKYSGCRFSLIYCRHECKECEPIPYYLNDLNKRRKNVHRIKTEIGGMTYYNGVPLSKKEEDDRVD